jgi:hypothetical protein
MNNVLCFDIMQIVGKKVEIKRQEIRSGFWKHNASDWRIVNNEFKNIVIILEKEKQRIRPKDVNPKTQKQYVKERSTWTSSYGWCNSRTWTGKHVSTPLWGNVPKKWFPFTGNYPYDLKTYIEIRSKICATNPHLIWAQPPAWTHCPI